MSWIKTRFLDDLAVTTAKINTSAVTAAKIGSLAVTTAKLDDLAVTAAKIANATITEAKKASGAPKTMSFRYSFAVQAGAQGAKVLTDVADAAQQLPANAVVSRAYLEVETALTSGGSATVELGITGNVACFLASVAFNDASLALDKATAANAALPLKIGAATNVLLTITTADLTAGVIYLHIDYVEGH